MRRGPSRQLELLAVAIEARGVSDRHVPRLARRPSRTRGRAASGGTCRRSSRCPRRRTTPLPGGVLRQLGECRRCSTPCVRGCPLRPPSSGAVRAGCPPSTSSSRCASIRNSSSRKRAGTPSRSKSCTRQASRSKSTGRSGVGSSPGRGCGRLSPGRRAASCFTAPRIRARSVARRSARHSPNWRMRSVAVFSPMPLDALDVVARVSLAAPCSRSCTSG